MGNNSNIPSDKNMSLEMRFIRYDGKFCAKTFSVKQYIFFIWENIKCIGSSDSIDPDPVMRLNEWEKWFAGYFVFIHTHTLYCICLYFFICLSPMLLPLDYLDAGCEDERICDVV